MEDIMDIVKLKVKFVVFSDLKEIIAVFMGSDADVRQDSHGNWNRDCYVHDGQHVACYDGMQRRKRATPEEYADLAEEMTSLGYDLTIM
jgi:hypothetical protein